MFACVQVCVWVHVHCKRRCRIDSGQCAELQPSATASAVCLSPRDKVSLTRASRHLQTQPSSLVAPPAVPLFVAAGFEQLAAKKTTDKKHTEELEDPVASRPLTVLPF